MKAECPVRDSVGTMRPRQGLFTGLPMEMGINVGLAGSESHLARGRRERGVSPYPPQLVYAHSSLYLGT